MDLDTAGDDLTDDGVVVIDDDGEGVRRTLNEDLIEVRKGGRGGGGVRRR